jgi:hypothetical protein
LGRNDRKTGKPVLPEISTVGVSLAPIHLVNRGDTFPIISQFSIRNSQFDGGKIQPEVKTSPTSAIYVHPNSENSHAHIWEFSP